MKRQKLYRIMVSLFLFLLITVNKDSYAQYTRRLDSVSVIYYKKFTQLASPLPVQVMSDSSLRRLSAFSVADALRYFAGVQLKDYGGIGGLKTVDIRNMGANHTGLLYDGVPMGNMQNGQVDLGKFSLDNVEEISLYNGSTSNMLQPASAYASGATIYITTRKPRFNSNERSHISGAFKAGSFGLYNPSVLLQHKLSKTLSWQASAERVIADGRYKFRQKVENAYDTTTTRENGDIHSWRTEVALFGKFSDSSELQTQVYYYYSDRGLPGAIVNNRYYNPQRLGDQNFFTQTKFTKSLSDKYRIAIVGKYAHDFTHYFDPTIVGVDGALNNYYKADETFLSISNEYKIVPYWKTQLSVDYRYNHLNANLDNFAYPTRNSILAVVATQYQRNRLLVQANLLSSFIYNKVSFGQKALDRKEYTPTIDFSWRPFSQNSLTIRSFYKNIFRMPSFNDLYYTSIGSVSLNPEFIKQYDLGFTYWKLLDKKGSFFSFQIDGFHNDIKDKIVAMPSQNLFRWRMVNLGKVKSNGVSAYIKNELHWSSIFFTNMSIQYTYENTKNKSEGNAYGYPVPYTPLHSGSAIVNMTLRNWELNYSYIYTGNRYNVTDINLPYSKLEAWYTHDLNIARKIRVSKCFFKCVIEVNNVFDQQYEVILNYPMPGRNYRIGIHFEI